MKAGPWRTHRPARLILHRIMTFKELLILHKPYLAILEVCRHILRGDIRNGIHYGIGISLEIRIVAHLFKGRGELLDDIWIGPLREEASEVLVDYEVDSLLLHRRNIRICIIPLLIEESEDMEITGGYIILHQPYRSLHEIDMIAHHRRNLI